MVTLIRSSSSTPATLMGSRKPTLTRASKPSKGAAVAAGSANAAASPFDLRVNKTKFSILNRKVIGTKGRPAQAKSRSHEVRKKSILPELARRGRASEFVDRRFGERNSALSSEDKMLERFSRERLHRSKKKSVFNLNSEALDEQDYSKTLTLTHKGQKIDEIDAFDSDMDGSEADSDGALDRELVSSAHFGGPGLDSAKKSKAEVMQEVIAKSKMHKYERQRINEQNAMLCEELDADFNTILQNLDTRKNGQSTEPAKKPNDEYHEIIKQMSFEKRVQPSDPTKSTKDFAVQSLDKEHAQRKRMAPGAQAAAGESYTNHEHGYDDQYQHEHQDGSLEHSLHTKGSLRGETDAERDILRVEQKATQHLEDFENATCLADANRAYSELAALSRTNSVIPVARAIRARLAKLTSHTSQASQRGTAPTMPRRNVLLLFHVIGKIFSTSDYHHIVVTPALLLIGTFLEHGRMLKRWHLLSSIFLMQTALLYQCESKRTFPELLYLLASLINRLFAPKALTWSQYPTSRFMSRTLDDFLDGSLGNLECCPVGFDDLLRAEQDELFLTREKVAGHLLHLFYEAAKLYSGSPASAEILTPLLASLRANKAVPSKAEQIESGLFQRSKARRPLLLQKFKAVPIAQLTPELNDGADRESRQRQRITRAYKREFKGAKRELKRDSAFLSQQKLRMRLEADQKYQERIRQVMGSISSTAGRNQK